MKNFPHQFALPERFIHALEVTARFLEGGGALADEWSYGEALVRGGAKNLLGNGTIDQKLAADNAKAAKNQSTRTGAKDIGRTLRLLGFVSGGALTAVGRGLLSAPIDAQSALLREAFLKLRLGDPPHVSRPYQLLLRLLNDHPGMPWANSLLALEAQDDSDVEYARVSALAERLPQEVVDELGLTTAKAANARKILPSLARHLGDAKIVGLRAYPVGNDPAVSTPDDEAIDDVGLKTVEAGGILGPELTPDSVAPDPEFADQGEVLADLAAGIAIRKKRTLEHQHLVRRFAAFLQAAGFSLRAHPFDLLANRGDTWLLVEAKTLNGSVIDARRQSERALGQLRAYSFFDLPILPNGVNPRQVSLFSEAPAGKLADFLSENGIEVVWPDGDDWLRHHLNQPTQFIL